MENVEKKGSQVPAGNENKPIIDAYKHIDDYINKDSRQRIKIHWFLVVLAVLITFVLGYVNDVSLFENLNRCFYAASAFWVAAEVIDFILKN